MTNIDSLVSTAWLAEHLDDPDLVVLDCSVYQEETADGGFRNVSGRTRYEASHIPGAGFADLKGELCSDGPVEFSVPSTEQFCAAMGALGVGNNSRVVLYDSAYSAWAARVWWMLRWIGFDRAAILDGGLKAWSDEGRSLETGSVSRATERLVPYPRSRLIADRDEVLAGIDDAAVTLVDTLPAPFYRGETSMYARPGHIPGAVNICGVDLLDDSGHYRPMEELAALHPLDHDARIITYCGGGILASSNAFVLTRLGFTDVAVYTASLQEWAADPDNPMVVETPDT